MWHRTCSRALRTSSRSNEPTVTSPHSKRPHTVSDRPVGRGVPAVEELLDQEGLLSADRVTWIRIQGSGNAVLRLGAMRAASVSGCWPISIRSRTLSIPDPMAGTLSCRSVTTCRSPGLARRSRSNLISEAEPSPSVLVVPSRSMDPKGLLRDAGR